MSDLTQALRKKHADDLKVIAEKPWVLDPAQCEHWETWAETYELAALLEAAEHAERALEKRGEMVRSLELSDDRKRLEIDALRTQLESGQRKHDELWKDYELLVKQDAARGAQLAQAEQERDRLRERDDELSYIESVCYHDGHRVTVKKVLELWEQAEQRVRASEIEGALRAWQMVLSLLVSGTPADGIATIARDQIVGLAALTPPAEDSA